MECSSSCSVLQMVILPLVPRFLGSLPRRSFLHFVQNTAGSHDIHKKITKSSLESRIVKKVVAVLIVITSHPILPVPRLAFDIQNEVVHVRIVGHPWDCISKSLGLWHHRDEKAVPNGDHWANIDCCEDWNSDEAWDMCHYSSLLIRIRLRFHS